MTDHEVDDITLGFRRTIRHLKNGRWYWQLDETRGGVLHRRIDSGVADRKSDAAHATEQAAQGCLSHRWPQ